MPVRLQQTKFLRDILVNTDLKFQIIDNEELQWIIGGWQILSDPQR